MHHLLDRTNLYHLIQWEGVMNDRTYFFIINILNLLLWDGELVGSENLREGPAVLVANHLGAKGPIGVVCSMPVRLYPWIHHETIDRKLAPEYVRLDFVEKELKLTPPLSVIVSKIICRISVPLLLSLNPVPVYYNRFGMEKTFQQSLELLLEGKYLFISPEDPALDPDPLTGIRPFMKGFIHLGELYAERTGKQLPFYPLTVHEIGMVVIDKPLIYNPHNDARKERLRLVHLLETTIKARYIELSESVPITPLFTQKRNL